MFFQIASDFHIEKEDNDNVDINKYIKPICPCLILCGDVGSLYRYNQLENFFRQLCEKFEYIIYVPGNHEFYTIQGTPGIPMYQLFHKLKILENTFDNLYVLNREILKIGNYCFIGCILWTNCPEEKEFPKFRVKIHAFSKSKYNRFNQGDIKFLQNSIKQSHSENLKPIVITHYPPSKILLNKRCRNDEYNYLYYNNLDDMLTKNMINIWICGHLHWSFDFLSENGTRLIGNQKGKNEDTDNKYSPEYYIQLI